MVQIFCRGKAAVSAEEVRFAIRQQVTANFGSLSWGRAQLRILHAVAPASKRSYDLTCGLILVGQCATAELDNIVFATSLVRFLEKRTNTKSSVKSGSSLALQQKKRRKAEVESDSESDSVQERIGDAHLSLGSAARDLSTEDLVECVPRIQSVSGVLSKSVASYADLYKKTLGDDASPDWETWNTGMRKEIDAALGKQ